MKFRKAKEFEINIVMEMCEEIKKTYPKAIMSGSGSTYFVLGDCKESELNFENLFINNLEFISTGVEKLD